MGIEQMARDRVCVIDEAGNRSATYKAVVGDHKGVLGATILDGSLIAEPGWKMTRALPNDREDVYTILDADYSPGHPPQIKPFYFLKLRKDSAIQPQRSPSSVHIGSVAGSVQIGDHNVQNITTSITHLVERIEASSATPQEKAEAKGLLAQTLKHPLVGSILGAGVAVLVKSLTT